MHNTSLKMQQSLGHNLNLETPKLKNTLKQFTLRTPLNTKEDA